MSAGGSVAKLERLAGPRMGEAQPGRVQRLAREVQQPLADRLGQRPGRGRDAAQIDRVAHHRIAPAGEVHANLVRPPGREAAFQQRRRRLPGALRAVAGERGLAAAGDDGHALAVARVAPDRALDLAFQRTGQAPGQREVGTIQIARGESRGQRGARAARSWRPP